MKYKSISILGCGWYGLPLAKSLVFKGYTVKGSTTSKNKLNLIEETGAKSFLINFDLADDEFDASFFDSEVLIVCLPPKRHAGEHKDYPAKIKKIIDAAKRGSIAKVLMISSTSVYADVNREVLAGELPMPDTEAGEAILHAEEYVKSAYTHNATIVRFSGLIGPGRNLARFFAGKTNISNGLAPINLIHLEDCIKLTEYLIAEDAFGFTLNASSPDHPSRMDFYSKVAEITGLELPGFIPELVKWKQINGNEPVSKLNYKYLVNNWSEFLTVDKL